MSIRDKIKNGWRESSRQLAGTDAFWQRTAPGLTLHRTVTGFLQKYAMGRILDVGAGTLAWKYIALRYCQSYESIDFKRTHPELSHIGSIESMPLPSDHYDSALSVQVLEHVPDTDTALREVYRVLKPGGIFVLSVPHYCYLHNEPYDFYRFTKYGIATVLKRAGFRVLNVSSAGGFFSFLHHVVGTALVGLSHGIPIIAAAIFKMNYWTGKGAVWLDRHWDIRELMALNYVVAAQKPEP